MKKEAKTTEEAFKQGVPRSSRGWITKRRGNRRGAFLLFLCDVSQQDRIDFNGAVWMNGNACPAALRSLPANAGICQIINRQPVCEADSFIGDRKRIQMVVPDEHSLRAAETDGRIKQGAGMIGTGNLFIGFSDGTV